MTRSRRLLAALVLLALAGSSTPAQAVPRGDERTVDVPARERSAVGLVDVPGAAWVVLRGHGWGHGHGMSQYGAGGAAAAGRSWSEILAFYYPGTERGGAGGDIRVHLAADTTPDLVVRHRPGLQLLAAGGGRTLPDGVTDQWRLALTPRGPRLQRRTTEQGVTRWRPEGAVAPGASFSAGGAPIVLVTPTGEAAYRGRLTAVPGLGTVNTLPLEDYVRGVVTREMPASWPAQAVAAQAVAARTYAVRSRSSTRGYDVCDTTSCQVYGGVAGESPAGDVAVLATAGTVLTWQGMPALTMYSSSNGGRALAAPGTPYLTDQRDPWDDWAPNPNHTWLRRVADTALEGLRPAIGDLTGIEVVAREGEGEWGGRVTGLRLVGTRGSATVPGDEVKARLGLKERWFTLVGARRR